MPETDLRIRFIRNDLKGEQPGWTEDPIVGHYKEVAVPVLYGRNTPLSQDLANCHTIVIIQNINLDGPNSLSRYDKRYKGWRKGEAFYSTSKSLLTVTFRGSYAKAVDFYHRALNKFSEHIKLDEMRSGYDTTP